MELNKEAALKLWDERYGKQTQTKNDFAGRNMSKGLFGRTDSKSGWTLDHRQPKSLGGTNKKCNIEIVNHKTNTEKADKTTFEANGKTFQVQRDKEKGSGCYKIVRINNQPKKQSSKKQNWRDQIESLYQETISDGLDFAFRKIEFKEFETESNTAWTVGYYQKGNTNDISNCYIANVKTVKAQQGKSSFKTNDMNFELKKIDGKYRYVNVSKIIDVLDYYNVLGVIKNMYHQDRTVFRDVITLDIVAHSRDFGRFLLILEEFIRVNKLDVNYYMEESNYRYFDSYVKRKVFVVFETPKENDTCTAHQFAIYMNSVKKLLLNKYQFREFTIYHTTHKVNSNEYFDFIDNLKSYFEREVRRNMTNTIVLSEDVKNYLIKCKYKEKTFTKINYSNYYQRDYIYTKLIELINKY